MNIFLSLFIIFGCGILGGFIFEKIKLPKLVWYIILGILIGPSVFNIASKDLINISSYLRQIALVIILTRSGLSLDIKHLKEIGRPAILMCFLPATLEIIGVLLFAPIILGVSILEALLMGSVLAAVSPAIVVPRMIKLKEMRYGEERHVPELIMAGASCDDIYVIVLFYSFKNLVKTEEFNYLDILQIPTSIVLGIILGIIGAILMILIIKYLKLNKILNVILMMSLSFGMLYLEDIVKDYVKVSSLLSIIVMALVVNIFKKDEAEEIQKSYNSLWSGFEILLFSLVGIATNAKYAFSKEGAIILGLIIIALVFRSLGVVLCLVFTNYNLKERIFILIAYLPKATVQASIGAIALSEGILVGELVLTLAVIAILFTAPLGAILTDLLYNKLLIKTDEIIE